MFPIRAGATHKVVVGPAVAVGDGFTPVTNLALTTADEAEVILHDNGTVVDISGYTWAAITTADGYYHLTLQSGISGTVGNMTVVINDDSLVLPLRADFQVIHATPYDSLYAASPTLLTSLDVGQLVEDTIGTVTSQTEFVMDTGIVSDDNWLGNIVTITDVTTGEAVSRYITDVVAATDSISINAACPFTAAIADVVRIESGIHPSYAGASAAALATVDTVVDAIKTETDKLVFTVANELDVNVQSINDAAVVGDGNATPWDGE